VEVRNVNIKHLLLLTALAALVLCWLAIWGSSLFKCSQLELLGTEIRDVPKVVKISSPAFKYGEVIPKKYTCDGRNLSPPLVWNLSGLGDKVKSFVLIVFDPDAPRGVFVHWLVYNIPGNLSGLNEGVPKNPVVRGVGLQGINDFGRIGYDGPCPPPGPKHRYFFRLIAVDTYLNLGPGLRVKDLEMALKGHVVGYGDYMGTYGR